MSRPAVRHKRNTEFSTLKREREKERERERKKDTTLLRFYRFLACLTDIVQNVCSMPYTEYTLYVHKVMNIVKWLLDTGPAIKDRSMINIK